MIEKIITSKTRVKLLKLFLTHMDNRYYLRELERLLNESLSPLRRQLLKLEKMGILTAEYEANLKYYRLNKNFAGIGELRKLVLGPTEQPQIAPVPEPQVTIIPEPKLQPVAVAARRIKYDLAVLALVSIFVLGTSMFVVYTGTKNIIQVADTLSEKGPRVTSRKKAEATLPDEMVSRQWKVKAGSFPVLSSGETGGKKRSEEL